MWINGEFSTGVDFSSVILPNTAFLISRTLFGKQGSWEPNSKPNKLG